ncbi:MAG: InlB B-repeat-containing protein [Chitinispirillales bacterium]|jgi:uncharacterized repeat protein (TIGR02543 family)|nr:InlB B-repeat-containing protein [Chitinispirillales bacterium]
MMKEHIVANPAPRRRQRVLFDAAASLSIAFCLIFAACDSNPTSESFDSVANGHVITFNKNGGDGDAPNTIVVMHEGVLRLPGNGNLTKNGYTFGGWSSTPSNSGNLYSAGETYRAYGDIILYARWNAPAYTITFNANGGTVSPTSAATNSSGYLNIDLPTPTRSGYTFDGWYTSSSGGTRVTTGYAFTGNTTIYAQWTTTSPGTSYTITLNANGGTLAGGSTVTTGTNGKLSSLPSNPTRSGYTFNGWYTSATGGSMITTDHTFTSNSTIYAQWTSAITYTITFNANGGSVSPTSGTTNTNGNLTSLPTPARGGYTFNGWYSSATGGSRITTDYQFTGNTTVYAQWAQIIITFSPNGGTVDRTSAPVGEDGTLADLPTPTRLGYTFIGWTDPNGEEVSLTTVFLASVTIRAQWEQNSYYTITFDANGGIFYLPDGPTSTDPRNTGDTFKLPGSPTIPVWPGYTFAGWYDAPTDGNRIMAENYETQVYPRSMTVYAHWTPIEEDVEE